MLDRGERSSCSGCGSSLRRNPLAGACQKVLCLGNGAPDDVFGRGDVLNEGDGFSAHLVLSLRLVWTYDRNPTGLQYRADVVRHRFLADPLLARIVSGPNESANEARPRLDKAP